MLRRVSAAVACLLVALAACTPARAPAPAPAPRARAPIVVAIVVDAFAAWEADERLDKLPSTGGFARLRREGIYARAMRYEHAVLGTAPGHASLYTGAVPRVHGIFANEWIDASGRTVGILDGWPAKLVGPNGPEEEAAPSFHPLRARTVADELRAEKPLATIVSLAVKDRGAILGGGSSRPDAVVWFDKERDRFVTSTAYNTVLPVWARPSPGPAASIVAKGATWSPLDRAWLQANAPTPDAQPGEADYLGLGRVFPHDPAATTKPAAAFRATPFADEAILALALLAIDGPRKTDEPMLLALSLSTNDYVGHVFGPDSWEAWDAMRRLDAALARFFGALDARFGEDGWAALVTGDHGATPMPEVAAAHPRPAMKLAPGERISQKELLAELRAVARQAGEPEAYVAGVSEPYIYLAPMEEEARAKLVPAITAALLRHPSVARVFDTRALPATCPAFADQSIDALVCRSVRPEHGGALYVVTAPGSFFSTDLADREGGAHGGPYDVDRVVPLLVRLPGRAARGVDGTSPAAPGRGRNQDAPVEFSSFARTASALLGVPPPASIDDGIDLTRPTNL
jgi:arylsulfatase A-like enzyme